MAVLLKKTLVLKPVDKNSDFSRRNILGMIKLQLLNGKILGKLNITGANDNSFKFTLAITDGIEKLKIFNKYFTKNFDFELQNFNFDNLCAFVFEINDTKKPLLYGCLGLKTLKLLEYLNYYEKNYQNQQTKHPSAQNTTFYDEQTRYDDNQSGRTNKQGNYATNTGEFNSNHYDDEAIATENYYNFNQINNGETTEIARDNYENLPIQTAHSSTKTQDQTEKTQNINGVKQDQTGTNTFTLTSELPAFYQSIKDRVDTLFLSHPPFLPLAKVIPNSKWIKIDYQNQKHCVVGIIFQNCIPNYVVYGIPGDRLQKPNGAPLRSLFLPASLFDLSGSGYWCTFQSAVNGEIHYPCENN